VLAWRLRPRANLGGFLGLESCGPLGVERSSRVAVVGDLGPGGSREEREIEVFRAK
jgi:hypothetical protein